MIDTSSPAIRRHIERLRAKSVALVDRLDLDIRKIMLLWALAAGLACGARVAFTFHGAGLENNVAALLPYMLVIGAPLASLTLGFSWFRKGAHYPQPSIRLCRIGRWRSVDAETAHTLPLYGSAGLMASLMLGMLVNVPVRSIEFLTAIPAIAPRPEWLGWLSTLMLADVVLLSSLYCIAFVAALRRVPLFPRMLVAIWIFDILMQTLTLHIMGQAALPAGVAPALHDLLTGNVTKVLVSVGIWLPYLVFSRRVNLTFRHRVPA